METPFPVTPCGRDHPHRHSRTTVLGYFADVVEGDSTTELDVPLDDLVGGGYAIAVHHLPDTLRLAVCGELPAAKRSKTRSRPPSRRS